MHTVAYSDPHWQVQSAVLLTPQDVVVAISRTGRTRDMIQTCDLAERAGATVIVITERAYQLARLADISLSVDVDEDPDVYWPTVGRLAQLALIDALAVAVAPTAPNRKRRCVARKKRWSPSAKKGRFVNPVNVSRAQSLVLTGLIE